MDGGHALPVGVEGLLEEAGMLIFEVFMGNAEFLRQENERSFRGIADDLSGAVRIEAGVIAERRRFGHLPAGGKPGGSRFAGGDGAPGGEIVRGGHFRDGHPVQGEGARLVAGDDGGAAEGLRGGKAADEGVLLRHALHAERHEDGRRGGEPFGDDGNGQGDRHEELLVERAAVEHACREDEHGDERAGDGQGFACGGEFFLERRLFVFLLFDETGDAAHFGGHAGGGDDARAAAVDDGGSGVGHIDAVGEDSAFGKRRFVFFRRNGFAGEGGFFDAEAGGLDEPHVGRHSVAVPEEYDVAADDIRRGDHALFAFPEHPRRGSGELRERRQGGLRFFLLHDADDRVDDDDGADDGGFRPFAEEGG